MFDISVCFGKLLKSTEGGEKKNGMETLTSCITFSHTAGHVLLNMSPKLAMMSMMDVAPQAALSELQRPSGLDFIYKQTV